MATIKPESPDAGDFRRGLHLLFAALSLLVIVEMSSLGWRRVEWLGVSWPQDGADVLLYRLAVLVPVALVAWLAFAVVDTRSGVKLVGRGSWRIGWQPSLVFAGMMTAQVVAPYVLASDILVAMAKPYYSLFYDELSGVAWDWLLASSVTAALTEELVFRGLLQRALEGYMRDWYALIVQALAFHLLHVHVYNVSPSGGVFVLYGLVYGLAFMRTRSLLAPIGLHFTTIMIHALAFTPALE